MNKIIKAALTAKFPQINIDNLMEIIEATPNAEVATEILLGIHEEIVLPIRVKDNGVLYTLVDIDRWHSRVSYQYKRNKSISAYFPEGTKKEEVNEENFTSLQVKGQQDVYIRIFISETEEVFNTCSVMNWLKYTRVSKEEEDIFQ